MDFKELFNIREDLWTHLYNTNKKIIMYGTGNGADKIIDVMNQKSIPLHGIFASDGFVRDRTFRGHKVRKYSDFCEEFDDFIVIVSFASQRDEVLENIYKIASERELYAPDVPVYGTGLFDLEYFRSNSVRFENVYNMLSDDLSRKTFLHTLSYKLTGKIQYLIDCETTKNEIFKLLGDIISNYNYIDVGAYTGDTVEEYTNQFGKAMEIYSFEPSKKNYDKMAKRYEEKNIKSHMYNAAAWDCKEILYSAAKSGRAASLDSNDTNNRIDAIKAEKIDDLNINNIGYIKIDAEGSDLKAIEGMRKIISNNLPVMKIAAYHKNDDYFTIPEKIYTINKKFRLYMRHLKYVPGWDTDFIFEFIKD